MTDDLLPYYERELAFIRRMGAEFARVRPKIAGRLRIGPDSVEDPNVSRLIEGFAFLTARIRRKLDDDFPELTEALLGTLYPHYLAPIPSMAIVSFTPQPDLGAPYRIERGTEIETEPVDGEPCRFVTRYPVTLHPIEVAGAALRGRPISAPTHPAAGEAASVLRITLRTLQPDMPIKAGAPDELVFFLGGPIEEAFPLYEMVLNDVVGVAVAESTADPAPTILPSDAIVPVGFDREEGLLDYPARAFDGYRLLSEYFAFPQKYLFFRVQGLKPRFARHDGREDRPLPLSQARLG